MQYPPICKLENKKCYNFQPGEWRSVCIWVAYIQKVGYINLDGVKKIFLNKSEFVSRSDYCDGSDFNNGKITGLHG